jgi:hypothetical protein
MDIGSNSYSSNRLLHCLTSSSVSIVGHTVSSRFTADVLQRAMDRGLLKASDRDTCLLWLSLFCMLRRVQSLHDMDTRPQAVRTQEVAALFVAASDSKQHEPAAGRLLFELVRYHTDRGLSMVMGVLNGGRRALSLPGIGSALLVSVLHTVCQRLAACVGNALLPVSGLCWARL